MIANINFVSVTNRNRKLVLHWLQATMLHSLQWEVQWASSQSHHFRSVPSCGVIGPPIPSTWANVWPLTTGTFTVQTSNGLTLSLPDFFLLWQKWVYQSVQGHTGLHQHGPEHLKCNLLTPRRLKGLKCPPATCEHVIDAVTTIMKNDAS